MLDLNQLNSLKNSGPKLIFAGTRPEIIKLAPIYNELKEGGHEVLFCATFQHTDLTNQTLEFFKINPEIKLNVAAPGQTLSDLSAKLLDQTGKIIEKLKPSCVIVQGDTMTVLCAAMSAFLHKVPVLHVEAGLRTGDLNSPFPEEANRKICTTLASLHFAPDKVAFQNLVREGCDAKKIFLVGNTVVDSLKLAKEKIELENCINPELKSKIQELKTRFKKLAIMTIHRRESFDSGLSNLASSLAAFIKKNGPESLAIIYPRHPNPSLDAFCKILTENLSNNIIFLPALGYAEFIYCLMQADFVITDSGGVLEEASVLGKPIVCVRKIVERPESLLLDNVFLTGFETNLINQALETCFSLNETAQNKKLLDIYGTGDSSKKIAQIIDQFFPKTKASEILSIKPAIKDSSFSEKKSLSVAVFGLGYVGLPTATVLSRAGFQVIGIDTNNSRLEKIKAGEIDFLEGNLYQDFKNCMANGHLKLSDNLEQPADFFIICVPTPLKDGRADLSYVFQCAESISKNLKPGSSLVILESTVPVGATDELEEKLANLSGLTANKDFFVSYCPERVLPGNMEQEIIGNDRVIGAKSKQTFLLANRLYKSFCTGNLSFVNFKSAELIKLLENSFRNVQVAFANEVYDISRELGLDATQIKEIANRHPRVNILNPGPGVGGHCVAIDPFFLEAGLKNKYPVLSNAISSNKARPEKIVEQIMQKVEKTKPTEDKKPKILIFGLTYKPNISDLRESPALEIALKLNALTNLELKVFDPNVEKDQIVNLGLKEFGQNTVAHEIENAQLIVFLVAHRQFKSIFKEIKLNEEKLLDCVCLLESIKKEEESPISI